jgi:hypothetical protein
MTLSKPYLAKVAKTPRKPRQILLGVLARYFFSTVTSDQAAAPRFRHV